MKNPPEKYTFTSDSFMNQQLDVMLSNELFNEIILNYDNIET
jgi:hypothetical protein